METRLENTIALLTRTPAVLDALLRDLPEAWSQQNEGGSPWNALEVVEHLIHADRTNWMPRARLILQSGETQPFDSFDRVAPARAGAEKLPGKLLEEFAALRAENLEQLRALKLGERELGLRGRHPALGSVTLSELLATWAVHDLTHLHQISRVLAYPYREAVGPWEKYLGVLQCSGHSSSS